MKVKEILRTANVAWSPSALQSIYLACGTVAQQLDATFSTSAKLEVFSLNLTSPGLDMPLLGSVESPQRFHKIAWSAHGVQGEFPSGVIVGGSDNGTISLWNADKIIRASPDAMISQNSQHVGAVRALDVNPFQPNLFASGASESEIFIWDLNNSNSAMSPGNKIHPFEDITGVAWNRQVQHILASTSPSGRSVVWDLRKNEPIIQVTDSSARVRCNAIAWHPDVATQMVTASGDDRAPVIQMWDLRYATAPMRTLEHHKKGVLSLDWCPQDSDLLLSAAKDNQVLCWNPNSDTPGGEVVYELPATSQWIFECHWCPRNPAIISTASFDGHISMYSLLGGGAKQPTEQKAAPAATDDIFADIAAKPHPPIDSAPLKTPPKWFRRPCGATFTFGGKLVSFGNTRGANPKAVHISQVSTEHELLRRSNALEESLSQQQFAEFCEGKVQESSSALDRNVWNFLKVTFEPEPRRQYLKLLGYDTEELDKQFSALAQTSGSTLPASDSGGLNVSELSQKLSAIPLREEGTGQGEELGAESDDHSAGGGMFGSEGEGSSSVFDNISLGRTKPPSSGAQLATSGFAIATDNDTDGLLSKALLVGNFEAAVNICISADRMAEAMVLAIAGGSDLLQRTQQMFFQKAQSSSVKLLSTVVNRSWTELCRHGNLENWREILAALVTYAGPEDFAPLCDLLGERLETEAEGRYRDNASLCYICSGNVDKFVECWTTTADTTAAGVLALQELVEKVVLLRTAVERERKQFTSTTTAASGILAEKLRMYASLLASQGSLATALSYLQQTGTKDASDVLHDRVFQALGQPTGTTPKFPFQRIDVQPQQAAPSPAPTQDLTPSQPTAEARATTGLMPTQPIAANPYAMNPASYHQPANQPVVSGYVYGGPTSEQAGVSNPYGSIMQPLGPGTLGTYPPSTSLPSDPVGAAAGGIPVDNVPAPQPIGMQPGFFNPAAAKTGGPIGSQAGMAPPPPPPTSSTKSEGNTWNDPPLLKPKKPPTSYSPQAPIMAPIMAPITAPVQPLPTPEGHPPTPTDQAQPSPAHTEPPSPAPVVQKPPIPQEHVPMVTAFDAALERCKSAAGTTAMKRKTEDISRKLVILYDLLRESRLSHDVLQGLHYIAQDTQMLNYQAGLARHTQMVSSGNFSEISSFMPGVKTLLQLGIQLRV